MRASWPVARAYAGRDLSRISLPAGGIGTGTVGFGGRGQFRDWELENTPAKGLTFPLTFLACQVAGAGARILEGALPDEEVQGWQGSPAPLAGLPRFAGCEFQAAYPFGRVLLSDPGFPVTASVEVMNPLVPGDADASGLPLASVRVTLTSHAAEPVTASVLLSVEAMVGHALRGTGAQGVSGPAGPSVPVAQPIPLERVSCATDPARGELRGLLISDAGLDPGDERWGTLAAAVVGPDGWTGPAWGLGKWNQGLFAMWRGFAATGRPADGRFELDGVGATSDTAVAGTLGARRELAPGGSAEVEFLLGWHFPNRRAWRAAGRGPRGASGPETVGNWYATRYADAWDVIRTCAPSLPELAERTAEFVSAFWSSDLPGPVKEAALFNLSTLRSQTFFRTGDGYPFGWEGCLDDAGSCLGSCTHVWNYDQATGWLFGGLARQMRELEYRHATAPDGGMSFRIDLPLERARQFPLVAADGQFGCVVRLYREWRLSGDDDWLRSLWPACRRSVEFAWIPGGWDADRDGLAEGTQHNTMDVEYYGPTPVIQGWYLAALDAAARMASALGDEPFAVACREVLASGRRLTEERLFNGRYYRQQVIPPGDFAAIAPRLRSADMGAQDPARPEFQIGDGCLLDQLAGDSWARLAGLGPVFDPSRARTALGSIRELNYVPDFGAWTNCMRTYAVHGERGYIVTAYPDGLPEHPMPYWSEAWTGLEYVYAAGLVQHGLPELAADVVAGVRDRFDGARRNPFDEAECGHHYARALASWGLVVALTGFGYDASSGLMTFARSDGPVTWFWSTGDAWGTLTQADGQPPALRVLHGTVHVTSLRIGTRDYTPADYTPADYSPADWT